MNKSTSLVFTLCPAPPTLTTSSGFNEFTVSVTILSECDRLVVRISLSFGGTSLTKPKPPRFSIQVIKLRTSNYIYSYICFGFSFPHHEQLNVKFETVFCIEFTRNKMCIKQMDTRVASLIYPNLFCWEWIMRIKNDLKFQIRKYQSRATCFDIILGVSQGLDVKACRPRLIFSDLE